MKTKAILYGRECKGDTYDIPHALMRNVKNLAQFLSIWYDVPYADIPYIQTLQEAEELINNTFQQVKVKMYYNGRIDMKCDELLRFEIIEKYKVWL